MKARYTQINKLSLRKLWFSGGDPIVTRDKDYYKDIHWVSLVAENLPANAGDPSLISGSGISPGDQTPGQPTPVFFPGKSHGQRSYSPWGHKSGNTT